LCEELELDARATDVVVTYLVSPGLLERTQDERIQLSQLAVDNLVRGSRHDLRSYFESLREPPACAELLSGLLKTVVRPSRSRRLLLGEA